MQFDDSVESTADSDLEDGELQKMLTSPLYAQEASVKPDPSVVQEREEKCTIDSSRRSHSLKVRKLRGNPMLCFHQSRETNVEFCVQKR